MAAIGLPAIPQPECIVCPPSDQQSVRDGRSRRRDFRQDGPASVCDGDRTSAERGIPNHHHPVVRWAVSLLFVIVYGHRIAIISGSVGAITTGIYLTSTGADPLGGATQLSVWCEAVSSTVGCSDSIGAPVLLDPSISFDRARARAGETIRRWLPGLTVFVGFVSWVVTVTVGARAAAWAWATIVLGR